MSNNGNPSDIRRNVGEGMEREKVLNGLLNKITEPPTANFRVRDLKVSILGLFGTNKTIHETELAMEMVEAGYELGHEKPIEKLRKYIGSGKRIQYGGFLGRKRVLSIHPQEKDHYKLSVD